jgi:hypothetical protein
MQNLQRQLERIQNELNDQGLQKNTFLVVMEEALMHTERQVSAAFKSFQLDLTTRVSKPKANIGSMIFGAIFSLLGSLPAIPDASKIGDLIKGVYQFVNDGSKMVATSFAVGYGAQYELRSTKTKVSIQDHSVSITNFVTAFHNNWDTWITNNQIAMHTYASKMWDMYKLPARVYKRDTNQVDFLKRLLTKTFQGVKPQGQVYRELLANYLVSGGMGLVMQGSVSGTWTWTIAGMPEDINRYFMPKLIGTYMNGCLNPTQNFKTEKGIPVPIATIVQIRGTRVIRSHAYVGQTTVPIRNDDIRQPKGGFACFLDQRPNFNLVVQKYLDQDGPQDDRTQLNSGNVLGLSCWSCFALLSLALCM